MPVEKASSFSVMGAAFFRGAIGVDGEIRCPISQISDALNLPDDEVWERLLPLMKLTKSSIETDDRGNLVLVAFPVVPAPVAPIPPANVDNPGDDKAASPEKPKRGGGRMVGQRNRALIIDTIKALQEKAENVTSRDELAKLSGVKRGSIHGIITRLVKSRVIRETAVSGGKVRLEVL